MNYFPNNFVHRRTSYNGQGPHDTQGNQDYQSHHGSQVAHIYQDILSAEGVYGHQNSYDHQSRPGYQNLYNYQISHGYQSHYPYRNQYYPPQSVLRYHGNPPACPRDPREALIHHDHHVVARTTEPKPRLAKEEVDKLEREFQRNYKPNSIIKKQLAEEMGVDLARINNWFQNRRAKAKQEQRARENEAKLKSEQSHQKLDDDVVKEYYPDGDHHDDLRPSAAPFPPVEAPNSSAESTDSSDSSGKEATKEEQTQMLSQGAKPNRESSSSEVIETLDSICQDHRSTESISYTPDSFSNDVSSTTSPNFEQHSHLTLEVPLPDQIPSVTASAPSNDDAFFASFSGFTQEESRPGDGLATVATQCALSTATAGVGNGIGAVTDPEDSLNWEGHLSPGSFPLSPMSTDPSAQFEPPPIDLASRRKTKPPARLGLGCMRRSSYNSSGMKTNADMSRRMEVPRPLRRVASATGDFPRGIQKPASATPRSPMFLDRSQEDMLLQMASTTPMTRQTCNSAAAPPTPNTPVLGTDHGMVEQPEAPTMSSEAADKSCLIPTDMMDNSFPLDPTMNTPPDTPGLVNNVPGVAFPAPASLVGHGYNVTDEPVITPVMGTFDAAYPTMPMTIPTYVMPGSGSQPPTPSFAPYSGMGPAYLPWLAGGNPEYNWLDTADLSAPERSKAKTFQFTNMTPQDFDEEDSEGS